MRQTSTDATKQSSHTSTRSERLLDRIARHWPVWLAVLTGVWGTLPWLAPVLMHLGASGPAYLIYLLYSPQCHQLPQRSYFLFGDRLMVPLADILAVTGPRDPLTLRWFVGTPDLGWKVAWSDRMVSLYTPLFLGALVYSLVGRRWRPLRWSWALLPYVPLLLDGLSHLIDDTLRLGIRTDNSWLAVLTGNLLAPAFYGGDALGSFNWWARLLTGLLAGFAFVWQFYPLLDRGFTAVARTRLLNENNVDLCYPFTILSFPQLLRLSIAVYPEHSIEAFPFALYSLRSTSARTQRGLRNMRDHQ